MPISRYEIRNEYSLADPDLYRAADKDDPEALLEGVAMAGLVGVLRQLGDLAEFAADVFHNLHEEVMVTAARGHGLVIRVQQLETEVPSIERAFLSQTDHSSFFYHGGVDWHPSLHIDQNVVTQGDLPRFVMDSYEECRAPPRLFLLDKFDVAGAGACLKRYTDPSFFKVETSAMTRSDVQREKKIRKAKKKGPRWRNGETPEVIPTSHAKLHQLFLEEPVENGVSKPYRRAKLKRRLNGFSFESETGRSYMEKLLRTPTPDHKVLPEVTVNSPPLILATTEHDDSGHEIRPVSPERESVGSKRSPPSSPDREEIMLDRSMYEPSEVPRDDKICEVSNSFPSIATDDMSSSLNEVSGEKVIAMDTESNREGSLTGYRSDDIASEVDNYVDAPSTMDSEMDTDSEMRGKSDLTSSRTKTRRLISDAYEEHFHTQSPDSQSTGDSTTSDKGNNSSRNEMSSFSSGSLSTTAENPQPERNFTKEFGSADIHGSERVDASSYQKTSDEDFLAGQHSKLAFADDTCLGRNVITNYGLHFDLPTSSLCSNESVPTSVHSDLEGVGGKGMSIGQELDETVSTLDDKEKKTNLVMDPPCSPSVPDFQPQSGDDSPRSSAGENLADERNGEQVPCISTIPDSRSHTTDSSADKSLYLLHVDESGNEDHNLLENIPDMYSQNTNGTPGMILSRDLIPSQLDDEIPELPEIFSSDHPDRPHNENNVKSTVSKGESVRTHVLFRTRDLTDKLGNEDSNVSAESPNHFPISYSQTENAEDNQSSSSLNNQISSENPILLHLTNSPELPWTGVDAHVRDVIPDKETILNESIVLETPNDSEALENSCTQEHLEQPAGTSDAAEAGAITMCMSPTGQEVNEIAGSSDLKSTYEAQVLMDESDSKSDTEDMACAESTISGDVIIDNVDSPVGINRSVEEYIQCFDDSGLDELEYDINRHLGSHEESGPGEKVDQTEASTSGFGSVFCNTVNDDNPKTEVSDAVPSLHLDLEDDYSLEVVHAATSQLPLDQIPLDREKEDFQQSGLRNHVADTPSLQVDCDSEESVIQERIGLPCSQPDQESLKTAEISSGFSTLQSVDHQQMPDHSDHEVDNTTSPFSLVDHQNPPSVSEFHNGDPGYHNNLFASIFPPSNPFSATNHINLADSPQLPPLPPVQWRMRKLERASSSTEGQIMKHKESFPQLNSPMTISANDVSFPLPTLSTDDVSSSPPTSSTNDVSSSPLPTLSTDDASSFPPTSSVDDVSSFPLLTVSSDEVDSSPPTSSINDVSSFPLPTLSTDYVGSLPPTSSTNNVGSFPLPTLSTDDVSSSPVKASTNDVGSSPVKASTNDVGSSPPTTSIDVVGSSPPTTAIDDVGSSPKKASSEDVGSFPPTTSIDLVGSSPQITSVNDATSSVEDMKPSLIQISPETSSEEEKTKTSCSNSEAEIMHETVDLPPKIENKHQQMVIPTSESESPSPAEEDGVANGSRTVKLPRPRNPLVEDVAALDKSKLRKVTERVMPQIQKVDERDSLLEQIRAKSFNLKPAVASRPSIRGPNTNLKVAAILEKANAIRQAFAGSDEDDDDSWSDS